MLDRYIGLSRGDGLDGVKTKREMERSLFRASIKRMLRVECVSSYALVLSHYIAEKIAHRL